MKTHWPGLWERVERGEIAAIDAFFAENCSFAHEAEALAAADLMQASREGHLCIPAIRNLPHSSVHFENNLLYLQRNWILETKFLSDLKRLQVQEMEVLTPPHLEGLNQKQAQAVSQVFSSSFSIITGGPGTGKTFTAAHLISSFLQAKPDARIAVSAPTGKAASLFSSMNCRSGTIHALLGLPLTAIARGESALMPFDLVIVDECSMIEAPLFCSLLGSIGKGGRLVLMGDPHQLPPVGSGSLFADLVLSIKSGFALPMSALESSHRVQNKQLLALRDAIQKGDEDTVLSYVASETIDVNGLWEKKQAAPLGSFCLLSTLRKGPFGVDALNHKIKSQFAQEEAVPILITQSNAKLKLYNGETGVLKQGVAHFSSGRSYPVHALPSFEGAYALSVHKSQGSEYDNVALLVPEGSESFGKEILYTAATRAKQEFAIYGKKETILKLMRRGSRKISGLCERLTV